MPLMISFLIYCLFQLSGKATSDLMTRTSPGSFSFCSNCLFFTAPPFGCSGDETGVGKGDVTGVGKGDALGVGKGVVFGVEAGVVQGVCGIDPSPVYTQVPSSVRTYCLFKSVSSCCISILPEVPSPRQRSFVFFLSHLESVVFVFVYVCTLQ